MGKQPEISVIVPVYNLEKYIGATLESLVLQEGVCLEVLVIDDGSTDSTKHIVARYAEEYPYIKMLSNERMKGVSGARNTALQHMTGETFFFLDGDDILPPNALAPLLAHMRKENVPLVRALLDYFCEQRWLVLQGTMFEPHEGVVYPEGTFTQYLYNTKIAQENNILFPEGIIMAEDRIFFCEYFCHVSKMSTLFHYVYTYRINHKPVRASTADAISFITHFIPIRDLLEKHNKAEYYIPYLTSQFTLEWLNNIYYAIQGCPKTTESYLQACVDVLCDKKDILGPALNDGLQGEAIAFWKACEEKDTKELFSVLKKMNLIKPLPTSYIGINEKHVQSQFWKLIRCAYRVRNTVSNAKNARKFWYVHKLHAISKKFLSLVQ